MTQTPVQHTSMLPSVRFASGTNAGIGVWLILAPFILGYSNVQPALWNDIIVGAWLLVVAGMRAVNTTRMEGASWTNAGFGLWLILAPFILGYSSFSTTGGAITTGTDGFGGMAAGLNTVGATWNDIVVGALVIILAVRSASTTRAWRSVRDGAATTTTTRTRR